MGSIAIEEDEKKEKYEEFCKNEDAREGDKDFSF